MKNSTNNSSSPKKPKLPPYVTIKHGRWYVRRYFPAVEQNDGRPQKKYVQIVRRCDPETEEEARKLSDEIEHSVLEIRLDQAAPATVAKFITNYLERKKSSVSHRTHEYNTDLFWRYISKSSFARLVASDVRASDVERFYGEMQARGASADAVRKTHQLLSGAWNHGVRW